MGIGRKNWFNGSGMNKKYYYKLMKYYDRMQQDLFFPYYFLEDYFSDRLNEKPGENFGKPCIQVLVNQKMPEKLVEPDVVVSIIAKEAGLDVLTDVVEVGEIKTAFNDAIYKPVTCRVSGGNGLVPSGGTLGCVVKRKVDGKRLLLSCNHVLNSANNATHHADPVIQLSNFDNEN